MKRFIHGTRLSAVRASVLKLALPGLTLFSQGCGGGDTGSVEAAVGVTRVAWRHGMHFLFRRKANSANAHS
ncbi:MAG: hypothetical protein EBV89_01340 [Betaproteobacteria bacterium]|nr:hypothetical protein [Betaproteobacteria bacterium]